VNIKEIKSCNLETQRVVVICWEQAEAVTNWRERYEKIKEKTRKQEGSERAPISR